MIVGHEKQWSFLKKSAEKKRLSHAYFFYGPPRVGKKTIAFEFAKLINNHPEQIILLKQKPEAGAILISQIIEIKQKMSLAGIGEEYKVAIIDVASKMTFDAQCGLLKLLEEPRGNTVIILIAERVSQFLPTIASRCQLIRFGLVDEKIIIDKISKLKISSEKIREAVYLSFGKPGAAIDYIKDLKKANWEKENIKEIKRLGNVSLYEKFQAAERFSKEDLDTLNHITGTWLNYFRAILLQRLGKGGLPNMLKDNNYSLNKIKSIINFLEKIRLLLNTTNISPRLALEVFFMKI